MYSTYGKSHNGTVLIKAYLLACFPSSAQLFVCLIVCNSRSDNKRGSRNLGQRVSKQTKNPFTFCSMTFAIAFYRDTFIKDATRHSPRTDSASRNSLSTS